ncbi:MAG: histidine phosphatase family protein [Planctomycetales bacterium]|nr:histidine phosphatase family protein [bacterium]UNM08342.1 MAG: histidine phosphatase family protein [Planctomycetales bacterium]
MALYLVRHGQTDWNRAKRFQSTTDVPLNETGFAQAWQIREELDRRGVKFTLARSSPLVRAVETARIIVQGTDTPYQPEPGFMEISFGDYEGRLETELQDEYGSAYTKWRESQYTTAPPGGESILDGAARVKPYLIQLLQSAIDGDVLVVAHQAINMAMKVAISGRSDVESAAGFRQNNDEVDVWDMQERERIEMWKVHVG